MSHRIKQVNEVLKEEIGRIILKEIDFGSIIATITDIDTSADLRHAKVKICAEPEEKAGIALKIINKNIYKIQKELDKKLYMKPVPKLSFETDKLEIRAQRVEEILKRIENKGK